MNIVFLLEAGAFGLPSLAALAASHTISHIISQPDRPAGRGGKLTPTPVSAWAAENNIPLTRTENANAPEILAQLRALAPACIVVIAFGQKLSDELLSIAPHGGINLHSSLLPRYRGAAPINWAVINNDPIAGVSVIEVTNVMDGGAILATAQTPIGEIETAGELHDRLAALVRHFFRKSSISSPPAPPRAPRKTLLKNPKLPKLSREMAWVDFCLPADLVSARIRGLVPWPGVAVELIDPSGKPRIQATILKCRALGGRDHDTQTRGQILPDKSVACAVGSLQILTLQPHGKKPMDLASFANGYGYAPGAPLTQRHPQTIGGLC